MNLRFFSLGLAGLASLLPAAAQTLILADNGTAKAEIAVGAEPSAIVAFAARELKEHLDLITGGDFKILPAPTADVVIRLGASPESEALGLSPDTLKPDGCLICATNRQLFIVGLDNPSTTPIDDLYPLFARESRRGTLMGVYTFLEQLGVRWPAPGPSNVCARKCATLTFPGGLQRHEPAFTDRRMPGISYFMNKRWPAYVEPLFPDAGDYCRDNREAMLWALRLKMSIVSRVDGCHTEHFLQLKKIWADHPERFAWINGERNFEYSCWTDPAVVDIWRRAADAYFSGKPPAAAGLPHVPEWTSYIFKNPDEFMIDPMDYYGGCDGRCRCERCNAFREKNPCEDDTEIIWRVIADVAKDMAVKHPGKYITTLVYPPKKQLPKYTPLPENVRVRICMHGPGALPVPRRMEAEQAQIGRWAEAMGDRGVLLWTYQCEAAFGRKLPGVPETYPHLIADFLKRYRTAIDGMYFEIHAPTHTFRNRDMYIAARLLWDPSRDVDRELADYYAALYGPAAEAAGRLFQRFENNWIRYWTRVTPNEPKGAAAGAVAPVKQLRQVVWTQVYSPDEMRALEANLGELETAAAALPVFARRAGLIRTWIFDIMRKERVDVMDKEDRRRQIVVRVPTVASAPTAADWARAPQHSLVSAWKITPPPPLAAAGQFRLLRVSDTLYLHAELQEPELAGSLTQSDRKTGDRLVYADNDAEIFLYSVSTETLWQIIVNDQGKWSSLKLHKGVSEWVQLENFHVEVARSAAGWSLSATIPLDPSDTGERRFNLCRSRKIKGQPNELSTWSPLATVNTWQDPDNLGTLILDEIQP